MATFKCLAFILSLISSAVAISVNTQKDLDLTKCITNRQALFIKGIESVVDTSDPLSLNLVNIHLPDLTFKANNTILTGLKYCVVTKLRANREQLTFNYNLECPSIEFKGKYFLKGQLSDIWVEGEGDATVTTGFYIFKFHGYYDKIIEEDQMEHARIRNYFVDFKPREKIVFKLENLSDEVLKFMDENWSFMDQHIGQLVLQKFMDEFIQHLNDYLKSVPIIELFNTC